MFKVNDDLSIYVTRGDIVILAVTAADEEGVSYQFQPGDLVRIKVSAKKNCEDVVLQKDFPVTSETFAVEIYLDENDTKIGRVISKPTDYWYEVELNPLSDPQTIIGYDEDGAKIFKLFPEGADKELNEYDPSEDEHLKYVDDELDLSSKRPLENQVITRAFYRLEGSMNAVDDETKRIDGELKVERERINNIIDRKNATVNKQLEYLEYITDETKSKIDGNIVSDGSFATITINHREANLIVGGSGMGVFLLPIECRPIDIGVIHTAFGMNYRIDYDHANSRYHLAMTALGEVTYAPTEAATVTFTYALDDHELKDIRVGTNGKTYKTAGEAVRGQINTLKSYIMCPVEVAFEQGTLAFADGKTGNATNYIRTKDFIPAHLVTAVEIGEGYALNVFFYNGDGSLIEVRHIYGKSLYDLVTVENAKYYKFSIKRTDGEDITPTDHTGFCTCSLKEEISKTVGATTPDANFEQGTYIFSDGSAGTADYYIRTSNFVVASSVTGAKVADGFVVNALLYDGEKSYLGYLTNTTNAVTLDTAKDVKFYKFSVRYADNSPLTPNKDVGFELLTVKDQVMSIPSKAEYSNNTFLDTGYNVAISALKGVGKFPTDFGCVCVADMHGDIIALEKAKELQQAVGDFPILNVGDIVKMRGKVNGTVNAEVTEYMEKAAACGVFHIMGQHEVGFSNENVDTPPYLGRLKANCFTHQEVFDTFFKPMRSAWGLPSLETPYFYKDFADGTRLIGLYQYNIPLIDDTDYPDRYKYNRHLVWYGQDQIDWFIDALKGTPKGGKIIVMLHQSEKRVLANTKNGTAFFSGIVAGGNNIINGTPITDIIAAYKNKSSLNESYSCSDTDSFPAAEFSFVANADFSGASGEFVTFIAGDAHTDYIGVIDGTSQCVVGLTASGKLSCDCIVEGEGTACCIVNAIGFNYADKYGKIARLGQQCSANGEERKFGKFFF